MNRLNFDRRRFLQLGGALTLGQLLPFQTHATTPKAPLGRFFLLIRVNGGMDVTLGLDPWLKPQLPSPSDMFVEYRHEDLIDISPNMKLGPACAALKKHAGDFSVINGVFLSQVDNGHGASMSYITSGTTDALAPDLSVEVALATSEGAFGVLSNLALHTGNRAPASSSLEDIKALPHRADLSGILRTIFSPNPTDYMKAVRQILDSGLVTQNLIRNLQAFGPTDQLTENQIVAAAFASDAATCAQIDLRTFNLDTHSDHAKNHLTQQTQVWNQIEATMAQLKAVPYGHSGESIFDRTLIMVISEFARTPALNGAGGKDHNPMTNSVLLGGYGVQGGQMLGASRLITAGESSTGQSYHIAYPIDFKTGAVQASRTPQAQMIFPENVAQTVASIMDVDRTIFRSIPQSTAILPTLAKI